MDISNYVSIYNNTFWLKNIFFHNFKKIGYTQVNFKKKITVIQSIDQEKKKYLCRGIRIIFNDIIQRFFISLKDFAELKKIRSRSLNNDDIFELEEGDGNIILLSADLRYFNDNYKLKKAKRFYVKKENHFSAYKRIMFKTDEIIKTLKRDEENKVNSGIILPVIACYNGDDNIDFYSKKDIIKDSKKVKDIKKKYQDNFFNPIKAYYECLDEHKDYIFFKEWFNKVYLLSKQYEMHKKQEFAFAKKAMDIINHVSGVFVKEFKNIVIDCLEIEYPKEEILFKINNERYGIKEILEDDQDRMFFCILDIVHRILRLNGYNEVFFDGTNGIIFIENFEKFPTKYFSKFVKILCEGFPNIQFIIMNNLSDISYKNEDINYVKI